MKPEDILTLLQAGYTKAEIDAMTAPSPAGLPAPDPEPVPAPAPAPDPEPSPAPDPEPSPAPVPDYGSMIAQLTAQVSGLTKAVQIANLKGTNLPPEKTETAEDILAKLINPTYKKPDK